MDGFDIGSIRHLGISHDGGGVGVHQNDPVALFPQGFAGLRAGIVEFTGLTDDDGAGADEKNAVQISTLRHGDLDKRDSRGAIGERELGSRPHQFDEVIEQGGCILGAWAGFRMALEAESRFLPMMDAL